MKLAVIGTGYVGLVSGTCFSEIGNDVVCCDIDASKILQLQIGSIPIYEPGLEEMVARNVEAGRLSFSTDIPGAIRDADIIYIAVGTPMMITGEADMRYVISVAKTIAENLNDYKIIVNKSTVPVGTGRMVERLIREHMPDDRMAFDVVSNPEFLREGSALADCMQMERAVIGATSEHAAQVIKELHEPFQTRVFVTDLESAEMIKYASNCFLAMKISYINSIANICERVGADVTQVSEGMGLDSRIGSRFLQAGIGYGGSCFPKDTHALVHMAESNDYDFQLMKAVIATNEKQKLVVLEKLRSVLGDLKHSRIAVLGLSFKPDTDDMRDAPSQQIIPALLRAGAEVAGYDPIALKQARIIFGERISYYTDIYDAVEGADACLILTDWVQIKGMDLALVKRRMKLPIIVDGRNCFTNEKMRDYGFIYHSIGRTPVDPSS